MRFNKQMIDAAFEIHQRLGSDCTRSEWEESVIEELFDDDFIHSALSLAANKLIHESARKVGPGGVERVVFIEGEKDDPDSETRAIDSELLDLSQIELVTKKRYRQTLELAAKTRLWLRKAAAAGSGMALDAIHFDGNREGDEDG